jgi:hypothetical protein
MKRVCVVAAVLLAGAWGAVASSALAQESPETELDFVRKLSAKGYYDLTKDYIDELKKRMPQLGGQLDLEQARALVAMAREKDLSQRAALFNQAGELFNQFVKKFAGKPEAVQARLELAKLVAYHGQALLTKALREEDVKEQHEAARPAEAKFIEAGKQLEVLAKQLEGKEQVQAKFDRGVNYIDQARTYLDISKEANNRRRAELVDQARKTFEELATDSTSEVGLLANAWLVKCYQEAQDPPNVLKYFRRVTGASGRAAEPAQRLARYFYIQWATNDPAHLKKSGLDKIKIVQNEARRWIADYRGALKTWEGQGVRFELANAYLTEAQAVYKDLKNPAAAPLLSQAGKLFTELAELDGDFSEEASRRSIFIAATKLEKTRLEEIRDFDNAFLKAHVELHKLNELVGKIDQVKDDKERDNLETTKKQYIRDSIRAVNLALRLANSSTPVQKVDDARWLLATIYYKSGDLYRAAVAGEALARVRPPTRRGPQGAGLAFLVLDALNRVDPAEANRQKLRNLADFVLAPETQKFWAAEQVSAVARYQLAMLFEKEDNYQAAIDSLAKLPNDFNGYVYAQGQLAFIALAAAKDKAETSDEKAALRKQAMAAIQRMPASLPADADATTATMYFHAQMELPKIWYEQARADLNAGQLAGASDKFKQMSKFVEQHYQTFAKAKIEFEKDTKAQLDTLMTVLQKYGKLGLADVEYQLGDYDKVLSDEFAGAVVKEMLKKAPKQGPIKIKDHQVTGELVGLALRAHIQKEEFDRAKELFDVLTRLSSDQDGLLVDNRNMMSSLVGDMKNQVSELKKAKDAEKLQKTIDSFSKFVDGIAEGILKGKPTVRDYLFIGGAYGSLDQPKKAAELFSKVAEPKSLGNQELEPDELQEVQDYWAMRLQYAKALREAKEFKEAMRTLNHLLQHPNGQYHILAEFEKQFILHDNEIYGTAIKGWGELMNRLRERAAVDQDVKRLYFEGYYWNSYCWYKYSQTEKVKAANKEEQFLNAAANYIVRLERSENQEGWNFVADRYAELLEAEPRLKEAYENLKKRMEGK